MSDYEVSKPEYREAQRKLNRADSGRLNLSEDKRRELNELIRQYQTERLQL